MADQLDNPIRIGIGACVAGQPVRYSGDAKRKHNFIEKFSEYVQLVPICPEVGIGLGVPRETIRLVSVDGELRSRDSNSQTIDHTDALQNYAVKQLERYPDLSGYILVKGSPSCGLARIKVYNEAGNVLGHDGVGVFAARLMELHPNLPVEEDGRLNDAALRENFVRRVYVYKEWQKLCVAGLTAHNLIRFYARYKYMIMAHNPGIYKKIGPMLANAGKEDPNQLGEELICLIMTALKRVASRKGYTNAMQHIRGYLKRSLTSEHKQEIDRAIEDYRQGIVPLVVPMRLLQYQFRIHPDEYIAEQAIMDPYPEALGLRNAI